LDLPVDPEVKLHWVKVLIRLSRASGRYPRCMILEKVEKGVYPIARGGFGDVYKGKFCDREVAVKVLKIYEDSDKESLLKVIYI
jgi:hypothetical protein